jgi:hypothetical protein
MGVMVEDEVIAPKREHKTCVRLKGVRGILASRVHFVETVTQVGAEELTDSTDKFLCSVRAGEYSARQLSQFQQADEYIRLIVLPMLGYSTEKTIQLWRTSFSTKEHCLRRTQSLSPTAEIFSTSAMTHLMVVTTESKRHSRNYNSDIGGKYEEKCEVLCEVL